MITYTYTSSWSFPPVRPLKHKSLRNLAKTFQKNFNYISKQNLTCTVGILFHRLVQPAVSLSLGGHTYLPDQNVARGTFGVLSATSVNVKLLMLISPLFVYFHKKQEDVAFFSFPFSFEAFYMCEKESEGESENEPWCVIIISRALIHIELFSLHTSTWVFSKFSIYVFFRVNSTVASALLQGPLSGLMAALSHWRLRLPAFPCSTWYVTSKLRLWKWGWPRSKINVENQTEICIPKQSYCKLKCCVL